MSRLPLIPCLLLMVFVFTGCATYKVSQYTSPRITGRVLDGQTKQPLANVQVRKISGQQRLSADNSRSAAEVMEQRDVERTSADGTFVLPGQRDLAFLRTITWYSVTLSFRRNGYEDAFMTYTPTNSVKTASGEPLIEAGDILLFPVNKNRF